MNHDILEPEIWGFTNFYKKISDGSEFSIFGLNVMPSLVIIYDTFVRLFEIIPLKDIRGIVFCGTCLSFGKHLLNHLLSITTTFFHQQMTPLRHFQSLQIRVYSSR